MTLKRGIVAGGGSWGMSVGQGGGGRGGEGCPTFFLLSLGFEQIYCASNIKLGKLKSNVPTYRLKKDQNLEQLYQILVFFWSISRNIRF
jgi:hypothetical protein